MVGGCPRTMGSFRQASIFPFCALGNRNSPPPSPSPSPSQRLPNVTHKKDALRALMDPSFYSSCVWDKESLGISSTISENSGTFERIPHKKKKKKLPPSPQSAKEKGVILRKKKRFRMDKGRIYGGRARQKKVKQDWINSDIFTKKYSSNQ